MFHAVRTWWAGGRGKVTVRLFLFEFVVVVAGVLTAQALANWVTARAESRTIEEEDQRVRYETGRARHTAKVWLAALPCLTARVNEVARLAATGESAEPSVLKTPQFIGYSVEPIAPDLFREFHSRFGNDRVDNYFLLWDSSGQLMTGYREARNGWDRFALLDPTLGPPSDQDRSRVRDVAIQVRSQLRSIGRSALIIDQTAERLGIAPLTSEAEFGAIEPVKGCEEIWKTGQIWRQNKS